MNGAHSASPEASWVAYNSFNGRFSDNPRAIYEELAGRVGGLTHVWTAKDSPRDVFPEEATPVLFESDEHLRGVARSKFVVSNVEMRETLQKAPGVVFLQTWHGTPLKRIGYDNRYVKANPAGFERDVREYERWDYLISPNPFSSEIFREDAFRGFAGEILETGYPRNDALNAPDRDEVRGRVRAALGIEADQSVVLYAPTWRDNLFHEEGPSSFSLTLDVEQIAERLGNDHVILLRLHFLVAAEVADAVGSAARNVSAYPDIRELYLAADVLITDYSSSMFDFAVTGKPMVFFAYDLDFYRDEMRGFYFDFEAEAPGPICRTSDEVVSVLADRDQVLAPYRERYERFAERYCSLEDGHASRRVVDRVFSELL